jgi:hypothetical protein
MFALSRQNPLIDDYHRIKVMKRYIFGVLCYRAQEPRPEGQPISSLAAITRICFCEKNESRHLENKCNDISFLFRGNQSKLPVVAQLS